MWGKDATDHQMFASLGFSVVGYRRRGLLLAFLRTMDVLGSVSLF